MNEIMKNFDYITHTLTNTNLRVLFNNTPQHLDFSHFFFFFTFFSLLSSPSKACRLYPGHLGGSVLCKWTQGWCLWNLYGIVEANPLAWEWVQLHCC